MVKPKIEYLPCYPVRNNIKYPGTFHPKIRKIIDSYLYGHILSVCCGMYHRGVTVDLNPDVRPHVLADVGHLPFRENSFNVTVIDPPYTSTQARRLYKGRFPSKWYGKELKRVTRHRIIQLHISIAHIGRPFKINKIYCCDMGGIHPIRALTITENKNKCLDYGVMMVKARVNDPDNYHLSSFFPRFFTTKGIEVTYQEFLKEREFLMQPYLTRNKKKKGKKPPLFEI